jgi:hypothetical protein
MKDVGQWLSSLERRDFFRDLAPSLTVAETADFRHALATGRIEPVPPPLGARGWSAVPDAIAPARAAAMRDAVDALHRAGLPAIFAYVYDAFWEPLTALHALAKNELGDYDVLADAWVFRVEPVKRGWRAHRGWAEYEGGRAMLNAWIALTDTTTATSCIHIVPLDRDPNYPSSLDRLDVPAGEVVALEARAGTALVWDANALHWGGEMDAGARAPRMSLTFTLRKRAPALAAMTALDMSTLDLRARLDLIAGEIVKYAHMESVDESIADWAKLTLSTRSAVEAMKHR